MIKNASLILIIVFSLFIFNLNAEVKNENKPLKGEWDSQLQKIWEVGSAGDDVMVEARVLRVDDDGKVYGNVYLFDMKYFKIFVFSPGGKYLYHATIILPDGLKPVSPMVIKREYLYIFAEDDEGERKLVKYKISKPTG